MIEEKPIIEEENEFSSLDDYGEERSVDDMSFNELLADTVLQKKDEMVLHTIESFRKGEAGAFKIVQQALMEQKFSEENSFPATDDRFKEIISLAHEAIGTGEI